MNRVIQHLRANAVAYLALFVALGGTSYAALKLPANSVSGRQIQNHVIDPVKLNPRYITQSIRAWASVNAHGKIIASSPKARIVASVGADQVTWPIPFERKCAALVTVGNPGALSGTSVAAFADASVISESRNHLGALVSTYSVSALPSRVAYVVAMLCPVPVR